MKVNQKRKLLVVLTVMVTLLLFLPEVTITPQSVNYSNESFMNPGITVEEEMVKSAGPSSMNVGGYTFNTQISLNNNTDYPAYDYMVTNFRYGGYWLDVSNQGDMFVYESNQEADMWYSESYQDLSWRNELGQLDYISNNLGVVGVVDGNRITYSGISPNTTFQFENFIYGVRSDYILSGLPSTPASWLTGNISLSFGFNFKFSSSAIIYVGENEWDKSSEVSFSDDITFCYIEPDTRPPEWQSTYGSFKIPRAYAVDAVGAKVYGNYTIRKSGNRFYIYKEIPFDWLNSTERVFPVSIDPTTIDTSTDSSPLVGSNQIYTGPTYHTVGYCDGSNGVVTRLDVGDLSTYSTTTLISGTDVDSIAIIGYPNNDTIYIFWYEPSADDIHMKKSTDGGSTLGSAKDIITSASENYFWYSGDIALNGDNAGRIAISFRYKTGSYYHLWSRYSDDEGDTWTNAVIRSDDTTKGANPQTMLWLTGDVWLVGVRPWEGSDDDKWLIYRSTDGCGSWSLQFTGAAVTGQDVDNMQLMAPWKNATDRSNIVFAGMWRYGDIDDYTFGLSWDYGQTWMESQRNDQSYPDVYVGHSSFVVDGGVDSYDSHYVLANDDDSVSSTDDLRIAKRGDENWASTLSWSVETSTGALMDNRISVSRITNQDGYWGAVWATGTASPYDIVVYEDLLTPLNTTTAWYDTSWNRRKAITLGGITGAGPNYQIHLDIEYGSGTDSGNTVYMNTFGQTDFDDVRFTDNDGETLLDYYIEEYTASGDATFWVEVHDALDEDVVIYMYYQNSAVSDVSNGPNTFIHFDDFENDNFNRWTTAESLWTTTYTYYKYGSYSAWTDGGASNRLLQYDRTYPIMPSHYESMYDDTKWHTWFRTFDPTTATSYPLIDYTASGPISYTGYQATNDFATYNGASVRHYYSNCFSSSTTWYLLEVAMDWTSDLFRSWLDGTARATFDLVDDTDSTVTDIDKISAVSPSNSAYEYAIDDYWVRNYVYGSGSEPTVSSVATVEYISLAPVNDSTPTSVDMTESVYMLAKYQFYSIACYVSDSDGYGDIATVDFYLYSNDRGTNYWSVRYTEATDTFSELADASGYIDITTGSTVKDGTDMTVVFEVKVDWDHPDIADSDARMIVTDEHTLSDDDYYEVDWHVETRLDYVSGPSAYHVESLTERADYDSMNDVKCYVEVKFYGLSTARPAAGTVELWVDGDYDGAEEGSIAGGGTGYVLYDTPATVGSETITFLVTPEGEGWGGTDLIHDGSGTDTYISERVVINNWSVEGSDQRVEWYDYRYVYFDLYFESDNTLAGGSNIQVSVGGEASYTATWQSGLQYRANVVRWTTGNRSLTVTADYFTHVLTTTNVLDNTWIIWDRVNLTMSSNWNWLICSQNVTLSATGVFEFDGAAWSGTITWDNQYPTKTSADLYTIGESYITSITDPTYGITYFSGGVTTCTVIWDKPQLASGGNYFWTQYSYTQAYLTWGFPSTYTWTYNDTDWVFKGELIKGYKNGTLQPNSAIYSDTGDSNGLIFGPYTTTDYYTNIQVNISGTYAGQAYSWAVWSGNNIIVDILHSIHVEDSGFDLNDNWVTIAFHTNWGNATVYVWDNTTYIGGSFEGWYQFAKSTTVGLHVITILVNGSQGTIDNTSQDRTGSDGDNWVLRTYQYTVNPTTFAITEIEAAQNNESVIVMGIFHCTDLSIDYTIYEDGVAITTGTVTIPSSGSYYVIKWAKSSSTSTANWTLVMQSGSTNITVYGFNLRIDNSVYNYNSSGQWIDNTYVVGEAVEVAVARATESAWSTLGLIVVLLILPFVAGIAVKYDRQRRLPSPKKGISSKYSTTR